MTSNGVPHDFTLERVRSTDREARTGETILECRGAGVDIPHLCSPADSRADGNCRACVVEIGRAHVLAPSCCRTRAAHGGGDDRPRARRAQKMVLELLSDMPAGLRAARNADRIWAARTASAAHAARLRALQPEQPARSLAPGDRGQPGRLHPVHALRARLPRRQVNDVIGYARSIRGAHARIVFDLDDPMGASSAAWPAASACRPAHRRADAGPHWGLAGRPNGRFGLPVLRRRLPADLPGPGRPHRRRRGPRRPGQSRPAVREGRFGFDYVHHPHRLTGR